MIPAGRVGAYLFCALIFPAPVGCGFFTDAATRIAYDVKSGAAHLGGRDGARYSIRNVTPSYRGQCAGPYTAQFDKVGAIIVWCRDDTGTTVSSHSTSYHRRFVDTPQTLIAEKQAGESLVIDLQRRGGRAMIVAAR